MIKSGGLDGHLRKGSSRRVHTPSDQLAWPEDKGSPSRVLSLYGSRTARIFEPRLGVRSLSGDERIAGELWKRLVRHFDAMPGQVEQGASGNSRKVVFAAS